MNKHDLTEFQALRPDHAALINQRDNLLEALTWALDQIEDDLDPDHQAALAAARSLINQGDDK